MNIYSKRTAEKSQAGGLNLAPRKKTQRPAMPLKDNRLQAASQRQLQGLANTYAVQQHQAQELLQGNFLTIQRAAEEEEELLQGKFEPLQKQKNTTGLPDNLKSGMENLSGINLNHVNVHYNSPKPAAVQAHAYAQGADIHLAEGQEQHLPHELGHVVQQAQGRVQATTSVAGMAVNDNASLESEATSLGEQALRGG